MSKELVDNKMDIAYNLIEEGNYLEAVNMLSQLKIKCPPELIKEVKDWEDKKDKQLEKMIADIDDKNIHTIDKEQEKYSKLRDYSWDYYMYYNKIRRENELY